MLLKNYYGTGHSSMDNYLSMVSGQAPEEDTQSDCSVENTNFWQQRQASSPPAARCRTTRTTARSRRSPTPPSPSGANAPNGANGCTYPTDVPTLFNQLDAAGKTWKGYAQDLAATTAGRTSFQADTVPGREDAVCGGPGSRPTTRRPTRPS